MYLFGIPRNQGWKKKYLDSYVKTKLATSDPVSSDGGETFSGKMRTTLQLKYLRTSLPEYSHLVSESLSLLQKGREIYL